MNRNPSKKTTNVQAEAPPAAANEEVKAATTSGPPPLSTGWKVAILVWLLGFFGLVTFETVNIVWKLVTG
jgi:hypothetical protein